MSAIPPLFGVGAKGKDTKGIALELLCGNLTHMSESLRAYLKTLDVAEQVLYAERCGTTLGYLRKALSTKERISESTAIALDRESAGAVPVESVRPDVDWSYLRGTSKRASRLTTNRRVG